MPSANLRNFINRYLPWIFVWALMMVMTSIPNPDLPEIKLIWSDKVVHFLAFTFLSYLALRAFALTNLNLKIVIITLTYCIVYAALDEYHQEFIPGRSMELFDFIADVSGSILGIILRIFHVNWLVKKSVLENT